MMKLENKAWNFLGRFFPEDEIFKRYIVGAFWALFGNVAAKGLLLIGSIFIARFLGKVSFGELAIIKTTLSVFSPFATFGLGMTVTKFVAEKTRTDISELGKILSASSYITFFTGMLFGLAVFLLAPFIASSLLQSANIILPLRISGIYLFFNSLNVYQIGVISGLRLFRQLAKINVVVGIVSLPVLLVTTYFGGLTGTLVGLTISLVFNWFLNRQLIKKEIGVLGIIWPYRFSLPYIRSLLKSSYPLALSEAIYSFTNWLLLYLVLRKTNYGQIGIFNAADQWSQMILFLPSAISGVLLSYLSHHVQNVKTYTSIVKRSLFFNLILTFTLATSFTLFSETIFGFYGESFSGGERVLAIMSFSMIPMALINVFEQALISSSRSKLIPIFKLFRQTLVITTAFILLSIQQDAVSAAIALNIGYGVTTIVFILYFRKFLFGTFQNQDEFL